MDAREVPNRRGSVGWLEDVCIHMRVCVCVLIGVGGEGGRERVVIRNYRLEVNG